MNYDTKPYIPVLSPPGQYNAHIPSPNAANLPTSYHLIPVECSQGMIQTSPSSQHKQIFYSTTPPPPWVCNFHPPPPPAAVAAIPFLDGQAVIPSCSPPRFYLPLAQDKRKFESQTGSRHTPKARNLETDFKLAALRNGIRVEESPKPEKPIPNSSTTRASAVKGASDGNVPNIEPEALERNFRHAPLSPTGLGPKHRNKQDSTNTMSLDGKSPEATKWDSNIATNVNATAENQENIGENANSNSVEPAIEDLVEEFVINVILCAVNSLVQEVGEQPNRGLKKHLSQEDLDLRVDSDCQEDEKHVIKATDLLMDFKVDNDGTTSDLAREDEKEAKKTDLSPNPDSGIIDPNESVPNPDEAMPNPDTWIIHPNESMPNPDEAMPNMPNPDSGIIDPNESMPNPDESMPNPDEAMPNMPNPDTGIIHPNESLPNPSGAKSDPIFVKKQDKIVPISTENVPKIPSNNLDERVYANSPEDQEVEELFVQLALKKGIKVGGISPVNTNKLDSIPGSPKEDTEAEDLFVKRALQKGIKVGRMSPTSTGSLLEWSTKEENKDQDIEDLFVRLALRKGIKVGNISPVNDTSPQHSKEDMTMGEEFEKRALRNGIRLGTSHNSSNGNTSPTVVQVMPEDLSGDWWPSLTTPMAPFPLCEGVFDTNSAPTFARYKRFPTLVKFDSESPQTLDWVSTNKPVYRKNTSLGKDSFEELAKRNGIRVGETLKRKVNSQTQTENSSNSQETQTVGLIKLGNASTQVDATKEAFKSEFNEWMQEELSIIDPKASSFRELFLQEEEARNEAERRLAMEMDENVKAQRNTKMLIDELKEQLDSKQETIDKLNKEYKSLKKQKDNEIKRLTKELKQKDEDLSTLTHDNGMKEVVIESMREIAKEQSELVEKMEERLTTMEKEMENERKKSDSLVKMVSSKETSLQTQGTDEWQVVKGRHHVATKAAVNPKPYHQYYQLDGLSGFDDREYEKYNRRPSDTPISEGIQPRESLTGKNEGCVLSKQNVAAFNLGATSGDGMPTVSGDPVPPLPREPSLVSSHGLVPSLPPPGICLPRFPRELCAASVCTTNIPSTNSVCTDGGPDLPIPSGVQQQAIPVGQYNVSLVNDAAMPTSVVTNQDLPRAPYPTPGGAGSASLLPSGVPQQALPGGPYSMTIGGNEKVLNASSPSSCDTPLLPPGIIVDPALRQPLPSSKNKTTNKFSSFDKLMEALRDSFPDHSRPSLMVYLKKAKEAFGSSGFKGKQISEIVDKVAQVIDQE